MSKILKGITALSLALFVTTACGGGGGSDTSDSGGTGTPMTMNSTTAPQAAAAASVALDMATGMSSFAMPMPKAVADLKADSSLNTVMGAVNNYVNTALATGSARTSYLLFRGCKNDCVNGRWGLEELA